MGVAGAKGWSACFAVLRNLSLRNRLRLSGFHVDNPSPAWEHPFVDRTSRSAKRKVPTMTTATRLTPRTAAALADALVDFFDNEPTDAELAALDAAYDADDAALAALADDGYDAADDAEADELAAAEYREYDAGAADAYGDTDDAEAD